MIPAFCSSLSSRIFRSKFALFIFLYAFVAASGVATAAQVSLTWDANPQPAVAGYMLSYGQVSGAYTNKVDVSKVTTYAITGLLEGKTYYYAVTAYDAGRAESPFSNEASATTPYTVPVAAFNADKTNGAAPASVAFTSSSTGTISSYNWNFGDGTSSTVQNPPHTYASVGTYSVSLTATGPGGSNTSTRAGYIVVTAPSVTPAPTASFSATGTSGPAPLAVAFTSTSTGSINSYNWTFGDGTSSTLQNPSHSYATAGTYTVSLKVTGSGGSNTASKSGYIVVSVPDTSSVTANFTANVTSGPAPLSPTFTSTSTGTISSYYWQFGDGTVGSAKSVNHTYSKAGSYSVSLTVTGAKGNVTATKAGYINTQGTSVRPGLVAAYNFDAGTGGTVADLTGKNPGTIYNATWATNGRFGKALYFNGVDSWVTVNDSAPLDLTTGMTLEAWVYPTAAQWGWTNIIMKEQTNWSVYYLAANSDIDVPVGGVFVGGAERALQGKSTLPVNTWTHLATTYDGVTQKFFMNGVLVSSRAQTGAIQTSTGALRIGGDSIWGEYFKGMIDDVRIYNRAVSNSEIQADMLTPVSN